MTTTCSIADAVRRGETTAVQQVTQALERISQRNDELVAFVHLDTDAALASALDVDAAVARGEDPGPLAGVPFGVKDLEDCAGMPTRQGSLLFADAAPASGDAPHVARLRAAGAVPLGKTAVPELGLDSATHSRAHGVTRNPWDLSRTPGGSSGGAAAAVAAGLVPFATASDGGGSTRGPAANCGLVGLKPTHGLIGLPQASERAVAGVLTSDVTSTARLLDVMRGPTFGDRTSVWWPTAPSYERAVEELAVQGLRAAWSADLGHAVVEPQVAHLCETAALQLVDAAGLVLVDRVVKTTSPFESWLTSAAFGLRGALSLAGHWPARRDDLGPLLREVLDGSAGTSAEDVARAAADARQVEADLAAVLEDVDVLLTPSSACVPWAADGAYPTTIDGRDARSTGPDALLMVANLCWLPAVSVPAGLSREGLPVGLQVMARRGRDDVVLRLARIWEQVAPWPLVAP